MDYSDFSYATISSLLISLLPDCPKLKEDGKLLASEVPQRFLEIGKHFLELNLNVEELANEVKQQDYFLDIVQSLELYQNQLPKIFKTFDISSEFRKTHLRIQKLGVIYLGTSIADNFGKSLNDIKKRLKEIERTSEKLESLLQVDATSGTILTGLILSEINSSCEIKEETFSEEELTSFQNNPFLLLPASKYFKIKTDLEYLSNLESKFKKTWLAQKLQYGKSGPKKNTAIVQWIWPMVDIWVSEFGREISYSENPNSGREKFLKFAEACFQELHPTLIGSQPDVIRNAYEKLRSEGSFDYLEKVQQG